MPPIPAPPTTTLPEYPNCRDDHIPIVGRVAKATKAGSCLLLLSQYNREILQVFARRMEAYRAALRAVWGLVNGGRFTFPQKSEFFARISVEFTNSQRDGSYMDHFRLTLARYLADRQYLRTEICNLVRCPQTRRRR